jgi:hypothetical protein
MNPLYPLTSLITFIVFVNLTKKPLRINLTLKKNTSILSPHQLHFNVFVNLTKTLLFINLIKKNTSIH